MRITSEEEEMMLSPEEEHLRRSEHQVEEGLEGEVELHEGTEGGLGGRKEEEEEHARDLKKVEEEEEDGEASEDEEIENETVLQRIFALKDMIPINRRRQLQTLAFTGFSFALKLKRFFGATFWILITSALLIVVPLGLEIEKEQMLMTYQNEQELQSQAQQMLNLQSPQ